MLSGRGVTHMAPAKLNSDTGEIMQAPDRKNLQAIVYCSLLALQFGLQPMLASKFTPPGVAKSSVVIATELCKILITVFVYSTGPRAEIEKIRETWSIRESLAVAALPATLYAIQNLCVQYGYVLLDSMTFNLLNQTKTLSAVLWLYILLGQPQSAVQIFALLLLLLAAFILNFGPVGAGKGAADLASYNIGLAAVAVASLLSGLSTALTQRALTASKPRPTFFLSAEMAVYGIIFLVCNLVLNNDIPGGGYSLFSNWTPATLIPVVTNAFGGIVVGQVTRLAGGVVKGFALVAGLLVTGVTSWLIDGKPMGRKDLIAAALVSISIILHSKFPPTKQKLHSVEAQKETVKKSQ